MRGVFYLSQEERVENSKVIQVVSKAEYDDWSQSSEFRTAYNTLEAKQFFKSQKAVFDFHDQAHVAKFSPPYRYIIEVHVSDHLPQKDRANNMMLETHEAISIDEKHLREINALPL